MLRRKLLVNLGPLVVLLVGTSVVAILLLQGVLHDLKHVNQEDWVVGDQIDQLSAGINSIEISLYELQLGREHHLDKLIGEVETAQKLTASIKTNGICHRVGREDLLQGIEQHLPVFIRHVSALATVEDASLAKEHHQKALDVAVALQRMITPLGRIVREHAHQEQEATLLWFRWLVLGLAMIFLLVINVSVMVLMRLASMVLRPVDKLVEATRQLAHERFDYRVKIDQRDEFDELARAYNSLAEAMQANEQRKIEVLGQVAVAMNHELNNAAAIIDLQLQLMARQATGNPALEKCLRQIHESLDRMTRTVQSLKNVRRIVLTDYNSGMKMLDLQRSVEEEQASNPSDARASTL